MNRTKSAFGFICLATASLSFFVAANCFAAPPAGAPTANANEVAEFKGTLKGFQNGVLQIERADGKAVMVQPPTNLAAFTFIASAKMPFLQRGMLVRFNGSFHANGVSAAPIDKVEIFQPFDMKGVPGHGKDMFTPGIHPHDRHAKNKKPVGLAAYRIIGNLVGINGNGTIMVQAGNRQVAAQLAQTVEFEIRLNNLNLAQPGDAVSVAGFYNPPDDTKIRGDRITVTTDRIYGEPTEKAPPVRKRRTSRRKNSDDKQMDADPSAKGDALKQVEPAEQANKANENDGSRND